MAAYSPPLSPIKWLINRAPPSSARKAKCHHTLARIVAEWVRPLASGACPPSRSLIERRPIPQQDARLSSLFSGHAKIHNLLEDDRSSISDLFRTHVPTSSIVYSRKSSGRGWSSHPDDDHAAANRWVEDPSPSPSFIVCLRYTPFPCPPFHQTALLRSGSVSAAPLPLPPHHEHGPAVVINAAVGPVLPHSCVSSVISHEVASLLNRRWCCSGCLRPLKNFFGMLRVDPALNGRWQTGKRGFWGMSLPCSSCFPADWVPTTCSDRSSPDIRRQIELIAAKNGRNPQILGVIGGPPIQFETHSFAPSFRHPPHRQSPSRPHCAPAT